MTAKEEKPQVGRRRLIAYGLAFTLAGLLVLELFARWAEPAAYRQLRTFRLTEALAEYKLWQQALFMSFGGIHQSDPELLWKFRPRLHQPLFVTNSQGLLSANDIEYEKPPNTIRILLLGDSSPVGLGLAGRDEALGELTVHALADKWRGRKRIELLNAAVSGYTTEQGLRYLRNEGLKYQPDFIVCYFGNNDASINGYLTDREVFAAQGWAQEARAVLYHFALYRMMRNVLSPVLHARREEANGLPTVRVTSAEYGENLSAIADLARDAGARVILVNPPIPYRWPAGLQFKIFAQLTDSAGQWVVADPMQRRLKRPVAYCLDSSFTHRGHRDTDPYTAAVFASAYADDGEADSIEAMYKQRLLENPQDTISLNNIGVLYWGRRQYDQAADFFRRCLELDSSFNVGRFNLGITLADAGDSTQAAAILQETVDRDYYSLRIKSPYRRALLAVADSLGLPVVDGAGLFATQGNDLLFIDHCHPTPEGHRLLAGRLATVIDSLIQQQSPTL